MAQILQKVVIYSDRIRLKVLPSELMRWLSDDNFVTGELTFPEAGKLDVPCKLIRRGEHLRMIIESAERKSKPDASLSKLLQRAHGWRNRAEDEEGAPMAKLAEENGVTPSYFSRVVRLAYLAPDIIEAIIDGEQPVNLTASKLAKLRDLPIEWPAQRSILGFPPT